MDRIDLEQITFTQADVLRLVHGLAAKDLQNWHERKVLTGPSTGKGVRRQYTALGVIAVRFILRMVDLGLKPSDAAQLLPAVLNHALHIHGMHPAREEDSRLRWIIAADAIHLYHRGYVFRRGDKHVILIRQEDLGLERTFLPEVYITVEIDQLIISALGGIYALMAGDEVPTGIVITGAADEKEAETARRAAKFALELKPPGRRGRRK